MLHLHLSALFVFLLLWFCGSPEAEAEDLQTHLNFLTEIKMETQGQGPQEQH